MKRFWIWMVLLLASVGLFLSAHAQQVQGSLSIVSGVVAQVSTDTSGSLESATVNTTFGAVDLTFTAESRLRILGDAQLQPGDRIVAIVSGSGEVLVAVALHTQVSPSSTVKGTIVAVDTTQGTITLEVRKPRGGTTSLVLKVTSETSIRKEGRAVELSVLAKEDIAVATFRLRDNVALRIEAHSPPPPPPQWKIVRGTLVADVGADGSLQINLKGGGSVSAQVTEESRIIVKGEGPGEDKDLVAGSEVVAILQIDASGKVVIRHIVVEKPKPLKAVGTIHALADNRLILELGSGGFMEFVVNEKTGILLEDKPATWADLKQGMRAEILYRAEAGVNLALHIKAEFPKPEKVRGIVTEVVADVTLGQKITLAVEGDVNNKMTFVVIPDTQIEVDGEEASLAQVVIGSRAEVLFRVEGGQNIALEIKAQSPPPPLQLKVRGTIFDASDAEGRLTLKAQDGTLLKFIVTKETKILVDGKEATRADLKVGMLATITYVVEGNAKVALEIDAKTPPPSPPPAPIVKVFHGTLTADVGTDNVVKVDIGGGQVITAQLTSDSRIVIAGQGQGGIQDLKQGLLVTLVAKATASGSLEVQQITAHPPKPQQVKGTIEAVSENKLTLRTSAGEMIEFVLTEETQVTLDGKAAMVADLKAGQRAEVTFLMQAGVNTALRVKAQTPPPPPPPPAPVVKVFRGTLTADVGADNVVKVDIGGGQVVSALLTQESRILVEGKGQGSVQDLKQGTTVNLVANVTASGSLEVRQIVVIPPKPKKVEGVIQAVSGDSLTLKTKEGMVVQFKLTAETQVTLDGKPASVSDLKAGQEVVVAFLVQGEVNIALRVEAKTPEAEEEEVKGTVTAVSSDSITLAVKGDLSQQMTFVVNNLTEIKIGSRKATLQEIVIGSPAEVEFIVQEDQRVATEVKVTAQSLLGLHIG